MKTYSIEIDTQSLPEDLWYIVLVFPYKKIITNSGWTQPTVNNYCPNITVNLKVAIRKKKLTLTSTILRHPDLVICF